MEHICGRCARHLIWSSRPGAPAPAQLRLLSATASRSAEDSKPPSRHIDLSTETDSGPSTRAASQARYAELVKKATQGRNRDPNGPTFTIRRTASSAPEAQVLRRNPNLQGTLLRRPPTFTATPSALLRRTRPENTSSRPSTSPPQRPRSRAQSRAPRRARDEEADNERDPEEAASEEEMWQSHIATTVDPSPLPTVPLPYHPPHPTLTALRADWPNTPLSATGLSASVTQRLEPLASRLPHNHWTPLQLAEQYLSGQLTSFTSEAERAEVMKFARQLLDERAASLAEQGKTDETPAPNLDFSSLSSRAEEKKALVSNMVQGQYPSLQKQAMPFMNEIVRQLRNNESYSPTDSAKFMTRIQQMVDGMRKPAQQKAAA